VILTERSEVDGGSRRQPAVSFARWQKTPCIEPLLVAIVGALGVAAVRAMVDRLVRQPAHRTPRRQDGVWARDALAGASHSAMLDHACCGSATSPSRVAASAAMRPRGCFRFSMRPSRKGGSVQSGWIMLHGLSDHAGDGSRQADVTAPVHGLRWTVSSGHGRARTQPTLEGTHDMGAPGALLGDVHPVAALDARVRRRSASRPHGAAAASLPLGSVAALPRFARGELPGRPAAQTTRGLDATGRTATSPASR
jgi:hypothetical protein